MSYRKKHYPAKPERETPNLFDVEYSNPGVDRTLPTSRLTSGLPYQRPVDEKEVDRLIREWDDRLLEPLTVSFRDGRFNVVDGQHRIAAMVKKNGGREVMVPCKVYSGLSYEEEAALCYKLDKAKRRLSLSQSTNALVESGMDAEATEIRRLVEGAGFRWALGKKSGREHEIVATRAVINAYRLLGGDAFSRMLTLLGQTWHGAPHSLNAVVLSGLALFLKTYDTELNDRVFIKRLSAVEPDEIIRRGRLDFSTNSTALRYIRLSVEFNGRRGDSLETQREIMEAHLAVYPDIEIAGIYTDNGITGRTFEREAFQRMLADMEAGKINCVVVKDLSRLGRNTIDTGYYIEKYFPAHQVRFIAVNDQFDSENADNSGSHITVPLKNMINEAYAADISKKVRSQARQSMKAGEFIGARPPYGYRKAPENCHKLLPDENAAPVVRQIFAWAADGVPLNQMVKRLNEAGILTPSRYKASCGLIKHENLMGSGVWQTMTVAKILSDEVYTGDMVQGKTTVI